jgi:hypothetical protein
VVTQKKDERKNCVLIGCLVQRAPHPVVESLHALQDLLAVQHDARTLSHRAQAPHSDRRFREHLKRGGGGFQNTSSNKHAAGEQKRLVVRKQVKLNSSYCLIKIILLTIILLITFFFNFFYYLVKTKYTGILSTFFIKIIRLT